MTKKEKRKLMIAEIIKKRIDEGWAIQKLGFYDEAIDTMDESEKRLNQQVSDINEKHEDS